MVRWRLSAPASCLPASSRAPGGILDIGGAIQTGVGLGVPALLLGAGIVYPVENFGASLATGMGIGLAIGYVIILARKFTINQSNSTYGADVMMGAGNSSGRFLGPLIILSAMGASIPIGIGSLLGALLFYVWGKPITGGAILGPCYSAPSSRLRLQPSAALRVALEPLACTTSSSKRGAREMACSSISPSGRAR